MANKHHCSAAALHLCAAVQERKHLAFTLKDTKTIVGKLERIAAFVFHILMFFFYLVIFNVSFLPSVSSHVHFIWSLADSGCPNF